MTVLISETFGGGTTPAGWTETGAATFDYSGNSAAIISTSTAYSTLKTPSLGDQSYVEMYLNITNPILPASNNLVFLEFLDSGGTRIGHFLFSNSSAKLVMYHGAEASVGGVYGSPLATGETMQVKVVYAQGTGTDGVMSIYLAAEGQEFGAAYISMADGQATAAVDAIQFGDRYTDSYSIFDSIVIGNEVGDAVPPAEGSPTITAVSTVTYAGLSTDSFMSGREMFNILDVGDSCTIPAYLTVDDVNYPLSLSTDMIITYHEDTPVGTYSGLEVTMVDASDGNAETVGTFDLVISLSAAGVIMGGIVGMNIGLIN